MMHVVGTIMLTDTSPILDGFRLHQPGINGVQIHLEWSVWLQQQLGLYTRIAGKKL